MKPNAAPEIRIGDVAQLRKPHPCGSDRWVVVRLGADIGLRCAGCGRKVLLPRSRFVRRLKSIERPADASPPAT